MSKYKSGLGFGGVDGVGVRVGVGVGLSFHDVVFLALDFKCCSNLEWNYFP